MVLVDSSVWVDFYRGKITLAVEQLKKMMWRTDEIIVGDLIFAEVLQGANSEKEFAKIRNDLFAFPQITISDTACAIQSAKNYRFLRARGVTIRKTIDTLIATRCIIDSIPLLHNDRDFDPFVTHLGLVSVISPETKP